MSQNIVHQKCIETKTVYPGTLGRALVSFTAASQPTNQFKCSFMNVPAALEFIRLTKTLMSCILCHFPYTPGAYIKASRDKTVGLCLMSKILYMQQQPSQGPKGQGI